MQLLGSTVVHFGAASAAVSFVGGVLMVKFGGVLTAAALAGITCQLRTMLRPDTRAFVADYRGAVLATAAGRIAEACTGTARLDIPGALVARGPAQDVLRVYALRAEIAGLHRRLSSSRQAALSWAQQEAGASRGQ